MSWQANSHRLGVGVGWRELSLLSLMLMELSWIVPWYTLLDWVARGATAWQVFAVLGGVLLASHWLARLMFHFRLKTVIRQVVLVVYVIVAEVIGLKALLYFYAPLSLGEMASRFVVDMNLYIPWIPAEFAVALAILLITLRGLFLAREGVHPSRVWGSFQVGVAMILAYGLVTVTVVGKNPLSMLAVFLFTALLAMGAARIATLNHQRGGQRIPFDWRRVGGLIASTAGLGAVSLAVAGVVSGRGFVALISLVLTFLWRVTVIAFAVILSPVLYAAILFAERLREWVDRGSVLSRLVEVIRGLQQFFEQARLEQDLTHTFLTLKPVALWGIILLGLMVVVALALRWRAWRDRHHDELELQSLAQADLLQQLRAAMRQSAQDVADRLARLMGLRRARRLLAAARIRRIYTSLMDLCERLDCPRPASQTPLEFLPKLDGLFPAHSPDLAIITEAYLRVRYGELPESREEVEAVEVAWERVSAAGQEQLSARRKLYRAKRGPLLTTKGAIRDEAKF